MKTGKKLLSVILAITLAFGVIVTAFAADGGAPSVTVTNSEKEVTVGYKENKHYDFEAANLPEGAELHVFVNGEDKGETTYVYVNDPTEDYVIEARAIDKDGGVIASSGEIKVTVKNGAFDKALAFVKNIFFSFVDGVADLFGSFFVKILYALFNR